MEFHPIGVIHGPYADADGTPIQPSGVAGVRGTIDVDPSYADGIRDLDGFSHVSLLYVFDRSSGYDLSVVPFLDSRPRGVFATRAPRRPDDCFR